MANYGKKNSTIKNSTVYTPEILSNYLYKLISHHYDFKYILDPCIGQGALAKPFKKDGVIIVGNDIDKKGLYDHVDYCTFKQNYNIKDFKMPSLIKPDFIIMNPPFNGNGKGRKNLLYPHLFLKTMFEKYGEDIPLVMITGDNFLNNNGVSSDRLKYIADGKFAITSVMTLPVDIFPNVKFNTQVLFFNMPKLDPHYIFDITKVAEPIVKKKHKTKQQTEILGTYKRLDISNEEFEVLDTFVTALIDEIEEQDSDYAQDKLKDIKILKNILNNVKQIKLSKSKSTATDKARRTKTETSRRKIKNAYEALKKENKKITIYSIRKKANVAHSTADKHKDIFEADLI